MTKKLLALLLAMCMVFSVCAFSVYAEGDVTPEGDGNEAQESTEATSNSVELELENSYYANSTVTIKGTVSGDVSGVIVEVVCEEDRFEFTKTVNKATFESDGVSFELEDAGVGEEYLVKVYNFDNEDELLAEASFLIKKSSSSTDREDDGSNAVTVWIEGTNGRYIDETVVLLDNLKKPNVLELAEYVLDEAGREYKSSKTKVTAIASTPTGTTYTLKDKATSTYFKNGVWAYILNGEYADFDGDWTDRELTGGSEVVLFFGVPDKEGIIKVGYPHFTVDPESIGVKEEVTVSVTQTLFTYDVENEEYDVEENAEVKKTGKVYFIKRGAATIGTGKTTNADGEVVLSTSTVSNSWITSYQGGEILVSGYVSASKPLTMVSVKKDLVTDREGTVQAWVRIEGAHKTLLKRTKSAKIDEFDLYNFMLEVLEDEDIDYETNRDETNFEKFELKTTSGYQNENGDIHDDTGWYVAVNDTIYTPEDDLEDVEIFSNDEILFYFGDEDTVPVVYCKVDESIKVNKKAYAYFYSDKEMTKPIDNKDFSAYFDGCGYSDKRLKLNDDGRVTLPTVEKKGTATLWWGEQVDVKSDECPIAVYGETEISYTGTTSDSSSSGGTSSGSSSSKDDEEDEETYECDYCGDEVTIVYDIEYKNKDYEVCKSCRTEIKALIAAEEKEKEEDEDWVVTVPSGDDKKEEDETSTWNPGDYTNNQTGTTTTENPRSYLYPDPDIDWWAVPNVEKAHEYGLMSGTTYGYFEPLRNITRAEFTTIIARILGLDTTAGNYTQKFADVKPTDWHYGYVMAAFSAGYVTGKSDTSFAPNDYITREEMAVLVSRITEVTGNESDALKFADGADIALWARKYVAGVNQTGIMTGDQFGQFSPKSNVNRQTVATVAVRLYEYLGK